MKKTIPVILLLSFAFMTKLVFAQTDSILYHDNIMESQWGSSTSNDNFKCFVRFTPPVYPATLVGMRAYFRNADANSTCRWIIFKDPAGAAAGGVNLAFWDPVTFNNPSSGGIANQAYSIYKDMSSNPVTITSGDIYVGAAETVGWFGMAIDNVPNNSVAPDRQWTQLFGTWTTLANQAYNGQFGITAFFTPFTTGTEGIIENQMDIFPNPAYNKINIEVPDNSGIKTVKIFNSLGRLVLQVTLQKGTSVTDISNLVNGIYSLRLYTGDEVFISKLVKL